MTRSSDVNRGQPHCRNSEGSGPYTELRSVRRIELVTALLAMAILVASGFVLVSSAFPRSITLTDTADAGDVPSELDGGSRLRACELLFDADTRCD